MFRRCHQRVVAFLIVFATSSVLLLSNVSQAARVALRPPMEEALLSPDWKAVFTAIAAVVEDDDFQDSLREYLRVSAGSASGKANYCRLTCVICDEAMQVVALNLTHVHGSVAWTSIPRGVTKVYVSDSLMRGEQSLDLSSLPHWVKELHLKNITFLSPAPVSSSPQKLKLRKRQTTLNTFSCVRCGLRDIDWATMPALAYLDIAINPLEPFEVSSLPPTLRFFNASGCNVTIPGSALQSLPPSLSVLDISRNRIHGPLTGVVLPSNLEAFNMSYNELEGPLHVDMFPFTLATIDVSHNHFTGSIADLSTYLALHTIQAHHNNLQMVMWNRLPTSLQILDLNHNALEDILVVSALPATLKFLDVSFNNLTGSISTANIPTSLAHFDVSHNRFGGPIDLTKLSDEARFFYIQYNNFTGTPDLTNLPLNLRRILVHDNNWDSLMPPLYV